MTAEWVLILLLSLMIVAAIIAVEIKDLLSSVIALGACGIVLSLMFLLLQAPDLAIIQLIVEILLLVVLIRATVTRDASVASKRPWLKRVFNVAALAVILGFAWAAFSELPKFGEPLMTVSKYYLGESIKNGVSETGATNLVAGIVLDYRAYDTMAGMLILSTAVTGVLVIMRKVGKPK